MDETDFEKFPDGRVENGLTKENDFAKSMEGMGKAAEWDAFGNRIDGPVGKVEGPEKGPETKYDQGIADAAKIINESPLNELAIKFGLRAVIPLIENADISGTRDPVQDICNSLGVDSAYEYNELRNMGAATEASEEKFRDDYSIEERPSSKEDTLAAFRDMKELIHEVRGAEGAFAKLRTEAENMGEDYFEYVAKKHGKTGLTGLLEALLLEKERAASGEGLNENKDEVPERAEVENREEGLDGLDEDGEAKLINDIITKET